MTAALNPGRPFTGSERELLENTLELNRAELVRAVEHHHVGAVSLRFIYLGMIAEVARHTGHADILAEQLQAAR